MTPSNLSFLEEVTEELSRSSESMISCTRADGGRPRGLVILGGAMIERVATRAADTRKAAKLQGGELQVFGSEQANNRRMMGRRWTSDLLLPIRKISGG